MNSPLRSLILEARIYTAAQQREVDDEIRRKREKEQKRMLRERSKESKDFSAKSLQALLNNNDDDDDDEIVAVAVPASTASPCSQEKIENNNNTTNVKKNENDDDDNENIKDKKITTIEEKTPNVEEQNSSDDARDTAAQNSGKFTCFPICVKKSEICYSLLDSEDKVTSCMAKLMPVLDTLITRFNNTMNKKQQQQNSNNSTNSSSVDQEANTANYAYHLSWDCEWHQNEGENFSSPNTKLSLIQVGIAEGPLHTDSPILVLVFDLLKLKDATTTAALKQIFESPTRSKSTIQFAFDCRRDAKVMQRYNINLDHIFDLQLLERASRIEPVPSPMQHNYVFCLTGLHKIMKQYANQFEFFLGLKSGINADESEAHFLTRPLTRETLLYSAVDAAVLFLVFIAFDRDLGADRMKHLAVEVFDSSQRYAQFESMSDDVKMNEHGLLPLKIIPRLDGMRAGNERCSVCKRDVAVRAEIPCTVCRKRDIDLKRNNNNNNNSQVASSSSPTYSNSSASPTVGSPYSRNNFVKKPYNNNSLPPPKIDIPNDVLKSLLSQQQQQQQQPQNNYRQNNANYGRSNNYNNNNNTSSSGPYVTLPTFPNQLNNNNQNNNNFNLQALPAHQQVLMMMSSPPVPQPQFNNNNNNYYNNNNNQQQQQQPQRQQNNTNNNNNNNNNWGQTWNQNVPVNNNNNNNQQQNYYNGNGYNNNNNYYQQPSNNNNNNSWMPIDYNNSQRGRGRGNNNNNNYNNNFQVGN